MIYCDLITQLPHIILIMISFELCINIILNIKYNINIEQSLSETVHVRGSCK